MKAPGILAVAAVSLIALPPGPIVATGPAIIRLAVPGRANTAASIAARGDLVAVSWHAARPEGGGDIVIAVSRDGGASFAHPVQVNDAAGEARSGGELPPRVVVGASGGGRDPEIAVVWRAKAGRTAIRLARSRDGGRTFTPAISLESGEAAGDRGWHAAAMAPDGRLHAIWLDHRGLAPKPGEPAHVHGARPAGVDGVAMAERSALFYTRPEGAAAAERSLARGVCYCCKTALAAGPDGRLYAAWRHVYAGNVRDIAFIASRDGGRTFDAPSRVSEDGWQLAGCPDDGPAMAIGGDGRVHVVWPTLVRGPEPEAALFVASTADGRTFTPRRRVPTLGSPRPSHPQVQVLGNDTVVIAWDEVVEGRRTAALTVLDLRRTGPGGAEPPLVLEPGASTSLYPVLAPVRGGVVAAWTSGSGDAATIAVRRLTPPSLQLP